MRKQEDSQSKRGDGKTIILAGCLQGSPNHYGELIERSKNSQILSCHHRKVISATFLSVSATLIISPRDHCHRT